MKSSGKMSSTESFFSPTGKKNSWGVTIDFCRSKTTEQTNKISDKLGRIL